jgi:PAS domain S-box-containing protein
MHDQALRIATMQPFERDLRIVRPNGQVRSVHHTVAIEADASGVGVRVHGTVQDVTEERAAEQRLREQANLLNLTRDAIIVRAADGTIRFWNEGAERLYGWTADEVLGKRSEDFAYANETKALAARKILADNGEWAGETEHLRKDGTAVMVSSRWTAVPAENGSAGSVLVINTDLTERKRLESQILRTQRLESVGTLASGVAHDLNNILAPILMAAPLLRDEMPRRSATRSSRSSSKARNAAPRSCARC